jgi:hypothetical protein
MLTVCNVPNFDTVGLKKSIKVLKNREKMKTFLKRSVYTISSLISTLNSSAAKQERRQ